MEERKNAFRYILDNIDSRESLPLCNLMTVQIQLFSEGFRGVLGNLSEQAATWGVSWRAISPALHKFGLQERAARIKVQCGHNFYILDYMQSDTCEGKLREHPEGLSVSWKAPPNRQTQCLFPSSKAGSRSASAAEAADWETICSQLSSGRALKLSALLHGSSTH